MPVPCSPLYLAQLSPGVVAELLPTCPVVILAVGSTEAAGQDLRVGTDGDATAVWASRLATDLAGRGIPAVIAPALSYSVASTAEPLAGTIAIDAETAARLLAVVLDGFRRAGFHRVCLLSRQLAPGHLAVLRNGALAHCARTGNAVAFPDLSERRFARQLGRVQAEADESAQHALRLYIARTVLVETFPELGEEIVD